LHIPQTQAHGASQVVSAAQGLHFAVRAARNGCADSGWPRAVKNVELKTAFWKPLALLWIAVTLGLPGMLVYSAVRTYSALDGQKAIYLRNRVAAIASRLEVLSQQGSLEALDEEPGLLDVTILNPPIDTASDPLSALWLGHELFRTEAAVVESQRAFRAYVPFHDPQGLKLARIDMAESSSDFLVEHARHHVWIVCVGAMVFVGLSALAAWSVRRQFALEHLAHIGKMSAVLAHEIRNPLGTIKGFAQLLAEKTPQHETFLQPIISEALRLESLVKDLLLYGRPAQPVPVRVNACELAKNLEAHVSQMDSGVRFESRIEDVTFSTDPNLLEQAMLNLLKNAVEALHDRPGGVIVLEVARSAGKVAWRVVDNGPGLTAEARHRLYEPFYTSKAFGTGLGLSITRKLAQSLGGTLHIESGDGEGMRAEVRLPG